MILMRRWGADKETPAVGGAPNIPDAKAQSIPTLKMPTAKGWVDGHVPTAAPGLSVNLFASELRHPRWIYVLPNDDVLVAEAIPAPWAVKSAFDYAMISTMRRATAIGESANRITLFRDTSACIGWTTRRGSSPRVTRDGSRSTSSAVVGFVPRCAASTALTRFSYHRS